MLGVRRRRAVGGEDRPSVLARTDPRRSEAEARRRGCAVLGELTGHGIGRSIHEEPTVPNVFVPAFDQPLGEGTVITIEPILGLGSDDVRAGDDGWTILTADGMPSAHAEHTLVVSAGEPLVLTAAG